MEPLEKPPTRTTMPCYSRCRRSVHRLFSFLIGFHLWCLDLWRIDSTHPHHNRNQRRSLGIAQGPSCRRPNSFSSWLEGLGGGGIRGSLSSCYECLFNDFCYRRFNLCLIDAFSERIDGIDEGKNYETA